MAVNVVNTKDLSKEAWLRFRNKGLGGSDVGAILGFNRYKTAMQVYLEKTGQYHEIVDNDAVYWGSALEDVVAKEYSKRTGNKVRRNNFLLQHEEYPFLLANVDRIIVDKERGNGILECKTASAYLADDWTAEEVPPSYYLQVQHYLAVTGLKWGELAVLIGGRDFRIFPIERDDELIEHMIEKLSSFWLENVQKNEPPAFDGTKASSDLLKKLYPEHLPGSEIILPPSADELIEQYRQAVEDEKEAKARKTEAENLLKGILGECEKGVAGERTITWKASQRTMLDQKGLKADHPEIYEKYKNQVVISRSFRVN